MEHHPAVHFVSAPLLFSEKVGSPKLGRYDHFDIPVFQFVNLSHGQGFQAKIRLRNTIRSMQNFCKIAISLGLGKSAKH